MGKLTNRKIIMQSAKNLNDKRKIQSAINSLINCSKNPNKEICSIKATDHFPNRYKINSLESALSKSKLSKKGLKKFEQKIKKNKSIFLEDFSKEDKRVIEEMANNFLKEVDNVYNESILTKPLFSEKGFIKITKKDNDKLFDEINREVSGITKNLQSKISQTPILESDKASSDYCFSGRGDRILNKKKRWVFETELEKRLNLLHRDSKNDAEKWKMEYEKELRVKRACNEK